MGDEPDHRADVYCCGIVLFEMLTGEALFAPRTDVEAIEMAIDARVRSPRRSNPAVPHDLEDIVMTALQRDRDLRYASAKDLYTDLRRFLNHHYPAYVGSELGDLMQDVFAPEIAEDRRLDELAEQVIDELDGEREMLAHPLHGLRGTAGAREDQAAVQKVRRLTVIVPDDDIWLIDIHCRGRTRNSGPAHQVAVAPKESLELTPFRCGSDQQDLDWLHRALLPEAGGHVDGPAT